MDIRRGLLLPIAAAALGFSTSCAQIGGAPAGQQGSVGRDTGRTVAVSVQPVREGPIALALAYSGNVQPTMQVNVVPKVSGRIEKLAVDVGAKVKAGELLASLDRVGLESAVKQSEANLAVAQARLATVQAGSRPEEIAQAEAALSSAKARLAQVSRGATAADIQAAEGSIAAAESALQKAQVDLAKLRDKPTADDLKAAQLDLERTRNSLWSAQVSRDGTCGNARNSQYQCEAADATVAAAETALAQAQRAYDNVKGGAKPEDVAVAEKAVASAQAQLQSAQARLAQLRAGPTAEDLAIARASVTQAESQLALRKAQYTERDLQTAQAQVSQAQAALDNAKAQLAEADVLAPFDGVVIQRLLGPGALASSQSPLFVLASQAVEVAIAVEEGRLGLIEVGQSATIAVPAYPQQPFSAKVASVAPSADAKTHTFVVKVTPNDQSSPLRPGMFAEVRIVAREQARAVLAPKEALVERAGKSVLFVVADGKASMREVKTGLADDRSVEIASGVSPSELVVVAGQASLSDGDMVRVAGGQGQPGQRQQGTSPAQPGSGQPGPGQSGTGGQPGTEGQPSRQRPEGTPSKAPQGGQSGQSGQTGGATSAPKQ